MNEVDITNYKHRIDSAIAKIETVITSLLQKNSELTSEANSLKEENIKIKNNTQTVISQIEQHVVELEEVKNKYGNSHNNS